jgi:ankyrin repeat protein
MRLNVNGVKPVLVLLICLATFGSSASTLHEAVKHRKFDEIKNLISSGGDVNSVQGDGTSVLAWAAYHNAPNIVRLLLNAGADANQANDLGVTPLSLACENVNPEIVKELLDAGADPNIEKVTGVSALMLCANLGVVDAVEALIKHGAYVNASDNHENQTALMWAAAENHEEVVKLLVDADAEVNARSKLVPEPEPYVIEDENVIFGRNYPPSIRFAKYHGGFTPLYFAAQQGALESAKVLLKAGADINATNSEYGTPLIIALQSGHEDMAKFLLDNGADPNIKDAWGMTPLHYALYEGVLIINTFRPSNTDKFGWTRQNMPGMVKALLEKGADPNVRIQYSLPYHNMEFFSRAMEDPPQVDPVGATPFLLAAISSDIESMQYLLEYGADKNVETIGGGTAFMLAAGLGSERGARREKDSLEAVKFILSLGDVNVNASLTEIAAVGPSKGRADGRTPLHHAVYLGWQNMIRFLVENGVNIHAKDRYGMTPMLMAMGDPEGRLFRQIGAGNSDFRFRSPPPIENRKLSALLLELGAEPFTGEFRDRSGE